MRASHAERSIKLCSGGPNSTVTVPCRRPWDRGNRPCPQALLHVTPCSYGTAPRRRPPRTGQTKKRVRPRTRTCATTGFYCRIADKRHHVTATAALDSLPFSCRRGSSLMDVGTGAGLSLALRGHHQRALLNGARRCDTVSPGKRPAPYLACAPAARIRRETVRARCRLLPASHLLHRDLCPIAMGRGRLPPSPHGSHR